MTFNSLFIDPKTMVPGKTYYYYHSEIPGFLDGMNLNEVELVFKFERSESGRHIGVVLHSSNGKNVGESTVCVKDDPFSGFNGFTLEKPWRRRLFEIV